MFPTQFGYHRPESVQEAVKLLQENPDAKVLAGGHSLLPAMKLRLAMPEALIDLHAISALRGVTANGAITIGAMTTYNQLAESPELRAISMIGEAARLVGDAQVQVRGTLGGSLAHSDPAADYTAIMLAIGAQLKAVGPNGERSIDIEDFFVDLFTTSLADDEILTEIVVSPPGGSVGTAYEKQRHPASGYAVAGVAAVIELDGETCRGARIAVTGATTKATRASAAEEALIGQPLDEKTIQRAADVAGQGLELNGDAFASEEYRRHLVGVLTKRAVSRAREDARG
ncbi:MAG TPA: xanthine dehydrogenase family protein subunit M [Thermomicrobiales bacterium]|nr:xanthine dehydrogenase family protein subunit M [Thermomicrobiales bacterium]